MGLLVWLLVATPLELPAGGKPIVGLWLLGTAAVLAVLYFYVRGIARGARRAAL
jgi:hypothetical protein